MTQQINNPESKQPVNKSTNQQINYLLYLADNVLILGHRNSEWCGHGPVLEQDIAITNISLDLIGQARNLYQYAASTINAKSRHEEGSASLPSEGLREASEDTLAYLRDAHEFRNCLLVELPKGDWATTILRQFFFSAYQYYYYKLLQSSKDEQLAAMAVKSLKEVTYHLRWSSEWVIRLGDGTEESHRRISNALNELWPYVSELFTDAPYEQKAFEAGIGVDTGKARSEWIEKVNAVFAEANLQAPPFPASGTDGKNGKHTSHLQEILNDLQYMQRTYPNCEW
jgi:ring-1,2-phenylacetyl-CoA epoxidase subunit PaaC